jgi:hypothetical protein
MGECEALEWLFGRHRPAAGEEQEGGEWRENPKPETRNPK